MFRAGALRRSSRSVGERGSCCAAEGFCGPGEQGLLETDSDFLAAPRERKAVHTVIEASFGAGGMGAEHAEYPVAAGSLLS